MGVSPLDDAAGRLAITIKSAGKTVDNVALVSVDVEHRVNRITRAELVFDDADPALAEFELTDATTFKPGVEVEVAAGYEDDSTETIFKGIVVGQSLSIGAGNTVRLRVDCRHKAIEMTFVRRNVVFASKTDTDILKTVISGAGLTATVDTTSVTFTNLVQYYASDWDFTLARAEANGLVVLLDVEKVTVTKPALETEVLTITYGKDLVGFDAAVDASDQRPNATATTWEASTQKTVSETVSAPALTVTGPGDLAASTLASAVSADDAILQSMVVPQELLKPWADGFQTRAGLSGNQASVTFQGSAKAKLGGTIELAGIGERFGGKAYIGAVTHRLSGGSWLTTVETGLPVEIHAERHHLADPAAAGLIPPIRGLQIGVVQKLADDPDTQNRIKVKLPLLGTSADGIWARLGGVYASNAFGAFVLPELEDEVVVGFLNDDPAQAIVLGSLYSSKHAPPYTLADENNTKALKTREGLLIEFDEEKKCITIQTPAGNEAKLDDDGQTITLTDQTGNEIEMSSSGIKISSPKDITLDAQGKVDISAQMDFSATGGMNATMEAQTAATVKGSASGEISSSGVLTVKGSMVKIN